MSGDEHAVYVYGVVAASERPEVGVPGVGDESSPVRSVSHAGVAALVSDVRETPLRAARDARAHWRVLEEAASRSTVLPVRFGTVMESDRSVREELLAPNAENLEGLLHDLAGKVQLSVRAFFDEERLLADILRTNRAVATLRDQIERLPGDAAYYQRIRLGEIVAADVERAREGDAQLVRERLAPLAHDVRFEPPRSTDQAVNAAFLVDRARIDEFSGAVKRLAEEVGDRLRIRYVGPLPPYGFADAELTAWD